MPEDSHQLDSRERRSFWENHIEQWQISGLGQTAYCRKHRLKAHRFYYWRRRLLASQDGVSFLPVALSSSLAQIIRRFVSIRATDSSSKSKTPTDLSGSNRSSPGWRLYDVRRQSQTGLSGCRQHRHAH